MSDSRGNRSTTTPHWLADTLYIGHTSDTQKLTGATAFIFQRPLTATVLVCGSAPASRELAALTPGCTVEDIHGVVFSGGSVFGLESAAGLVRYQKERNIGVLTHAGVIPVCPAMAIFDLPALPEDAETTEPTVYPTPENIYTACQNAVPMSDSLSCGRVGAGKGAKVGSWKSETSRPGGFGTATCLGPLHIAVTAFVVSNSWGSVVHYDNPEASEDIPLSVPTKLFLNTGIHQNTTLVLIIVNVRTDRCGLTRIAKMATAGIARAIAPAFTPFDGDAILICSTNDCPIPYPEDQLHSTGINLHNEAITGHLAAKAVCSAIRSSVIAKKEHQTQDIRTRSDT